jgi:hypothetical protein
MSNPMNHLDRALDRSRRRAEEAKKTERPPLDPKRFEADEYLTDGTVRPKTHPKQSPLGLRPRHIADEARLSEIDQAIARFAAEGAAIPSEWEAERLELIQRDNPRVAIDGLPVHSAMEVLKAAMKADPDFARTWHDNLAMAVMDSESRGDLQSDHEVANDAAARFMKSAFDVDTTKERAESRSNLPMLNGDWMGFYTPTELYKHYAPDDVSILGNVREQWVTTEPIQITHTHTHYGKPAAASLAGDFEERNHGHQETRPDPRGQGNVPQQGRDAAARGEGTAEGRAQGREGDAWEEKVMVQPGDILYFRFGGGGVGG